MTWNKVTEYMLSRVPTRYRKSSLRNVLLNSKFAVDAWDNFTVLTLRKGKVLVTGVTKRNPRDPRNPTIARQVAWVRAYRRFTEVWDGKAS
jgi:hypothetical protein